MKAFRIISTEYNANTPSVFLFIEGEYYGCMIYPKMHKYPQDINYWNTATCSDEGRFFNVVEVELPTEDFESIKRNQSEMEVNKALLKPYAEYKSREDEYEYNLEVEKYNRPFDREINRLWKEIRNIILDLKVCE